MKAGLVGHTALGNAVGRVYSNWLALATCDVETRVLLPEVDRLWAPIADEGGFRDCVTSDPSEISGWADVIVAHKPWPGSIDVAWRLAQRSDVPLVVDVDDPDYENEFGESVWATLGRARSRSFRSQHLGGDRSIWPYYRARRMIRRARVITVSNPAMNRWYRSSHIVPHARQPPQVNPTFSADRELSVCFVGTTRWHKGIGQLREAVASLHGIRLIVTADAPADAASHEQWLGETNLAAGLDVVARSDVVCVPTLASITGRGQLPAKIVDGMLAGRPVLASALPPIVWALGDTGMVVPPGDVAALANGLDRLRDVTLRRRLGEAARERGRTLFSADEVGRVLAAALEEALDRD